MVVLVVGVDVMVRVPAMVSSRSVMLRSPDPAVVVVGSNPGPVSVMVNVRVLWVWWRVMVMGGCACLMALVVASVMV